MNLDDLRAELRSHADDVDAHAHGRIAGVRAKVAQRRRRKAGATIAATALVVGAIIGVPVVSHLSSEPDPVDGPDGSQVFPEQVNGDTRVAYEVGDRGDTSVTLEFTPEDTDLLLDFDCNQAGVRNLSGLSARATVNGKVVPTGCERRLAFHLGTKDYPLVLGSPLTAEAVADRWTDTFGVAAGDRVTVSLEVDYGGVEPPPRGPVGIAAYEMTGDRVEESGVALTREITHGDRTYRLADDGYDIASEGEGRASVSIPALDRPAVAAYGGWDGGFRRTLDSRPTMAVGLSGGIETTVLASGTSHTVAVDKSSGRGTIYVAYYVRPGDESAGRDHAQGEGEQRPPVQDETDDSTGAPPQDSDGGGPDDRPPAIHDWDGSTEDHSGSDDLPPIKPYDSDSDQHQHPETPTPSTDDSSPREPVASVVPTAEDDVR